MKSTVIITAGGIGKRMGEEIPKQFLLLHDQPIIMHTIKKFYNYNPDSQIIITLPKAFIPYWEELCDEYDFCIEHLVVEGGKERYHSIKKALALVNGALIFVHDAVRPLVSIETIESAKKCAIHNLTAIPVLPIKDSLRYGTAKENKHIDRDAYWKVQTPQVFHADILRKAYDLPYTPKITDDASLVEELGYQIHFSPGNEENIKITTPTDLQIANALLKKKNDL
ncbi:2-C-methyl-D-erythritol 4-phosphate cytidylyltransferase [Brumimicrobium salinarum]|uniref:2-C-methyl-D-erythritol 4-phosphate cytidylyltransferase n=1 Tax=Brumimicrobium salinarum TaxID=2058658 RepID=A0A2I0R0W8_9FLAO|nr:2-C-methyl-D-erythritol 4-phosphate cytidylyltransferase [Brumimicrobium salinarum]PKR80185.1 2-C-methyl-D-erythritol 4-phosphate cytidylyltransferase [Brumimicrobium salinarum]